VLPPDLPLLIFNNVQEYFIGNVMIIALSNICMNHNIMVWYGVIWCDIYQMMVDRIMADFILQYMINIRVTSSNESTGERVTGWNILRVFL